MRVSTNHGVQQGRQCAGHLVKSRRLPGVHPEYKLCNIRVRIQRVNPPSPLSPGLAQQQGLSGDTEESHEAHFWLNGYVNKQNCRIWSEANPQVYVETPLHPEKLTVWCALWAGGIIGPYHLKNDEGHNVTVNGDRYRAMITNFSFLN
ncbi:hypothetical protein TNCV_3510911 [Trichonephila clavipes]|nr:hypothetical protein TNCV_3510911 [Trichonephila clavipes]